jgi:hypothetical protein
MSRAARGGNVADMQLKFNEDGSFTILGTDAGGIEPTDISTHSWFNNPNIFKYTSVPVTVRDSQTIGRAIGDEHKDREDKPDEVYDYVYNSVVQNGTTPMDFLGVQSTDPRYEIRVNAFQADKEDIMKTFGISDIEEVFSLYEFNPNNPQLQGEGNALRMRLERSIQDEAKREAEASRYSSDTDEDKEAIKIEESRQKTYGSGVVGEREVAQDSELGLFEGEQEPLKTATFNLKNLETKAFENSPITIDNPQYAAFVEQLGGEQEAIQIAKQLKHLIKKGHTKRFEAEWEARRKTLQIHNDKVEKELAEHEREVCFRLDKKNLAPKDFPKKDLEKWERIYRKRNSDANYPFSVENVKEFAEFCEHSGGFRIG